MAYNSWSPTPARPGLAAAGVGPMNARIEELFNEVADLGARMSNEHGVDLDMRRAVEAERGA